MFLHSVVRFELSDFSKSWAFISSGRTASLGSRLCNRSRRCVAFRTFFWTDRGPSKKPGTGGRTLLGKQAWRPSHSQLNASPSSKPSAASSSLSSRLLTEEPSAGARRMKLMHFPTKSSTSIPVVESPRLSCVVRLADRSAVDTRSRESKVASEVCLTEVNSSFALWSVCIRPFEPGARYSARESKVASD